MEKWFVGILVILLLGILIFLFNIFELKLFNYFYLLSLFKIFYFRVLPPQKKKKKINKGNSLHVYHEV